MLSQRDGYCHYPGEGNLAARRSGAGSGVQGQTGCGGVGLRETSNVCTLGWPRAKRTGRIRPAKGRSAERRSPSRSHHFTQSELTALDQTSKCQNRARRLAPRIALISSPTPRITSEGLECTVVDFDRNALLEVLHGHEQARLAVPFDHNAFQASQRARS